MFGKKSKAAPQDADVRDDELVTESASGKAAREEALSKGPARHNRAVPPERRHGVRVKPKAKKQEAEPDPDRFPSMLYDKDNRTKIVKNEKELDEALATERWFQEPQKDFSAHRHIEGMERG